jgi:hypothetical protein
MMTGDQYLAWAEEANTGKKLNYDQKMATIQAYAALALAAYAREANELTKEAKV